MHRASRSLLLAAAAAAAVACTHTTGPVDPSASALALEQPLPAAERSALRAGAILFFHDPTVVEVPSSATAGMPFTVTVTTYGGGCISEDTTVVKADGQRADVVPYQRIYNPGPNGGACPSELRITRRQASVVFDAPGSGVVRVIGRAMPGDTLMQVQRTVHVR